MSEQEQTPGAGDKIAIKLGPRQKSILEILAAFEGRLMLFNDGPESPVPSLQDLYDAGTEPSVYTPYDVAKIVRKLQKKGLVEVKSLPCPYHKKRKKKFALLTEKGLMTLDALQNLHTHVKRKRTGNKRRRTHETPNKNVFYRAEISDRFSFFIFSDEPITRPLIRQDSYVDRDYHGELKSTLYKLLTQITNTKIERVDDFDVIFVRDRSNEIRIYLDHTENHHNDIIVVYRSKKQIEALAKAIMRRWF
ncbi:MAG: hypothetical protein QW750_06305 [Zestosphaera sp.]